jgi:hypothetical protein
MKFTIEMGSVDMICIPTFINIVSGTQKLVGGLHRHVDSMDISQANVYLFKIRA